MTKEVDLLSLSKASENTSTNSSKNTTKKEGLSLFDSLLVNNKPEAKETTSKTKTETPKSKQTVTEKVEQDSSSKETKELSETKSDKIENKETSKKVDDSTSKSKEDNTNKTISNDKTENTEEAKTEVKTSKNTNSLLDRMILESKKDLKNNTNELKQEKSLNDPKKGDASLLDKLVKDVKNEASEKTEEKTDKKQENQENKKQEKILDKPENEQKADKKVEVPENTKEEQKLEKPKTDKAELKEENSKLDKKVEVPENTKEEQKLEKPKADKAELKEENSKLDKKVEVPENTKEEQKVEKPENKDIKPENTKDDSLSSKAEKTVELDNSELTKESKPQDSTEKTETKVSSTISQEQINDNKSANEKASAQSLEKNTKDAPVKNTLQEKEIEVKTENKDSKVVSNDSKKIDSEPIDENERINIDKSLLKDSKEDSTKSNSKSLMDRLLDNSKGATVTTKQTEMPNETLKAQESNLKSNDVVTNIFLGNQKNSIYNQMLSNKNEAIKTVKDGKNIGDVKKGAEILDLNMKDASLNIEQADLETNKVGLEKETLLDRLAFAKNIRRDEYTQQLHNSSIQSAKVNTDAEVAEEIVNLNVSQSATLSIQNRIVGAQQQMSSMMSDIARNMYQNYKPPVTAFRINLFPSQLGHIAILMKSDKENGLNISMNMSNASTLDAVIENQGSLRDALSRNFNTNQASFNLEFNMQGENNSQNPENNQNNNQRQESHSSEDILESINENKDAADDINYM